MAPWQWLVFLVGAVLSAGLTSVIRTWVLATKRGLSLPRERDVHKKPVPRLGGVAIAVTFVVVTMGVYLLRPDALSFTTDTVFGFDRNLFGILLGVLILLGVGIVDDIRGLSPFVKLAFHFVVGIILAASFVLVPHITNPLGGQIELGALSSLFVILWVVALINVVNWLDGLDGLASGISLIATLVLFFLAMKPEVAQSSTALLGLILISALVGFLPFNFFPAKIFLGDSGSQVLGFLLAVFAIVSGGKLATAFLVLGVPILDVIWVISRRLLAHAPIYQADRFHLHHRLLQAGLNQRQAVVLLYVVSAAFGIVALKTGTYGKLIAIVVLIAIMVIGGLLLAFLTSRKTRSAHD